MGNTTCTREEGIAIGKGVIERKKAEKVEHSYSKVALFLSILYYLFSNSFAYADEILELKEQLKEKESSCNQLSLEKEKLENYVKQALKVTKMKYKAR